MAQDEPSLNQHALLTSRMALGKAGSYHIYKREIIVYQLLKMGIGPDDVLRSFYH